MLVQRSFQPPPLPTRRVVGGHVVLALARHIKAQLLEGGDHAGPVLHLPGLSDEFPDGEPDDALDEAPAPEPTAAPAEPVDEPQPDPNTPPVEGWTPRQLDQGWGAVLEGTQVADLPVSDQLPGTPIVVTDRRGDAWTTTLKAVVSRSDTEIVVTNTGRPRR